MRGYEAYTLWGTWSRVKGCVQVHAGHVPSGVPCDTHAGVGLSRPKGPSVSVVCGLTELLQLQGSSLLPGSCNTMEFPWCKYRGWEPGVWSCTFAVLKGCRIVLIFDAFGVGMALMAMLVSGYGDD